MNFCIQNQEVKTMLNKCVIKNNIDMNPDTKAKGIFRFNRCA